MIYIYFITFFKHINKFIMCEKETLHINTVTHTRGCTLSGINFCKKENLATICTQWNEYSQMVMTTDYT